MTCHAPLIFNNDENGRVLQPGSAWLYILTTQVESRFAQNWQLGNVIYFKHEKVIPDKIIQILSLVIRLPCQAKAGIASCLNFPWWKRHANCKLSLS